MGFRALAQFLTIFVIESLNLSEDAFATMARIYERSLQKTDMTVSVRAQ